jgi:hypothetical protein
VIGVVVRKCRANNGRANNAAVFAASIERTAAIEVKSNTELAVYNAELVRLADDYNARVRVMHQQNLALVELVRKHCPEESQPV